MTADLTELLRLNESHIKPAGAVLARAFEDDPFFTNLIPDVFERRNQMPYITQLITRSGVLRGEVYATSSNLEGVAVWRSFKEADVSRIGRSGRSLTIPELETEVIDRLQRFNEYAAPMHKGHAPFSHWYLEFVGVEPMLHGKGYGGTLLKAMFARIDRELLPCYLGTTNEKNVVIYQHYGFKIVEEGTIPGTKVRHWAMLREKSG